MIIANDAYIVWSKFVLESLVKKSVVLHAYESKRYNNVVRFSRDVFLEIHFLDKMLYRIHSNFP